MFSCVKCSITASNAKHSTQFLLLKSPTASCLPNRFVVNVTACVCVCASANVDFLSLILQSLPSSLLSFLPLSLFICQRLCSGTFLVIRQLGP